MSVDIRAWLLNALVPRSGYRVYRDLAYGMDARQKLDLYVPGIMAVPAPVILFFYGGNWQTGTKRMYRAFGEAFASAGLIAAVTDYRLYPHMKFPGMVEDAANALHYVRERAMEFGGDPERIFAAGHSAGAYNAVMLASDPAYLHDIGGDMSWLRGVIGLAGPYDFLPLTDPKLIDMFGGAERAETQPISFIDGPRPPMLLATGTDDITVFPRNTVNMAARLRATGSDVTEKHYPGTGHVGLILSLARQFRGRTTLRRDILDFIAAH